MDNQRHLLALFETDIPERDSHKLFYELVKYT